MTNIVVLDTETTGLEQAKGDRIIEICMQVYDLESRARRLNFVQRINPERSISAGSQAVHGITLADLAGKPTWEAVAPKVQTIMSKCVLAIAHNADFDMPFIGLELARIGLAVPDIQIFCTMESGRWATPIGKLPTLQELCFACDVPYDPSAAHAADYDVDRTADCFFRGYDWGFFQPALPVLRVAA